MKIPNPIGCRLRQQVRLALIGTSLAVTAPGAMAATITVNSSGDSSSADQCTLRDAIAAANQNEMVGGCVAGDGDDMIVFGEGVDTITLGGSALPIIASGSTLTIGQMMDDGESDDDSDEGDTTDSGITIDANSQSRIFNNEGNLTLNGLTLVNGIATTEGGDANARSGGAILNNGGTLVVNGGAMNNNTADRAGGAIEEVTGDSVEDDDGDDSATNNLRVTLNNVNFSGNNAGMNPGNGGAVHVSGAGDIQVNGGVFDSNVSEEGGALWNNGGTMTVADATFSNNAANGTEADMGGGAIFGNIGGANGTIVVSGSMFQGNMAGDADDGEGDSSASGGAILTGDGTTLEVTNSVFRDNTARRAGGAIEVRAGTMTTLTNVTGTGNDAGQNPGNGGFLHVTGDGDVTVTGGSFARNLAVEGGAFWNNQGEMTIDGASIVNNEATGNNETANDGGIKGGGGVFANDGSADNDALLTITNSRIANNRASGESGSGGGILVSPGASAEITDTRIFGNTANRAGGGIENAGGDVTLNGVTLGGTRADSANNAGENPGNGGGLHIGADGTASIERSSVGYNTAVEGGGLWNSGMGTLNVVTSTVSNNTAERGAGVYLDGAGGTITLDEVSVTNNNGAGVFAVDGAGGSITINDSLISGNDPNLGEGVTADTEGSGNVTSDDVAFNGAYRLFGGPTATQPLAEGSAAVDAASAACSDTDQRGADRPFGDACDAGAFELTDDPVVDVVSLNIGDSAIGQDDSEATVLGFTLTNNGDDDVTDIGGFSGYIERDDQLPLGLSLADVELTVYEDTNENGSFDTGNDTQVGTGSIDSNGTTFSLTFDGGAMLSSGDSQSYLVVATLSDSAAPAAGMASLNAMPLYAGGALLGLLGLASIGGIRRRTQLLLIVAAIALTLTACSDSNNDRNVNTGGDPGQPGMNAGEVRFVIDQLDRGGMVMDTDLLIGDGLPITGPTLTFAIENDDSDDSDNSTTSN